MWLLAKRLFFTALRIWLGFQWLEAGLHKVGEAAWTGSSAGAAVAGFARGAIAKAAGENPTVQAWYAEFLENVVLPNAAAFGYLVAWGEVFVGLGLILGVFTGFAAFAGAFMNINFLLAGTVSTNPILLIAAIVVLVGIEYAEHFGIDWYLRPRVEDVADKSLKRLKAIFGA